MSTNANALRRRAQELTQRLNEAGLQAEVDENSLRDFSLKVSLVYESRPLGRVVIYYKPSKSNFLYKLHEMNDAGRAFEQALKQCWFKGAPEAARREVAIAAATLKADTGAEYAAYVDGSYIDGRVGYGAVILKRGEVAQELSGRAVDDGTRQISGEIAAAEQVLEWCRAQNVREVTIHHDLVHLGKWATGEYKANKPVAQRFVRNVKRSGVSVTWRKVEAHSGDEMNDRADMLAREGALRQAA